MAFPKEKCKKNIINNDAACSGDPRLVAQPGDTPGTVYSVPFDTSSSRGLDAAGHLGGRVFQSQAHQRRQCPRLHIFRRMAVVRKRDGRRQDIPQDPVLIQADPNDPKD